MSASPFNLEPHQLTVRDVHHNLPPSALSEHGIRHEAAECPGVAQDILQPRRAWADPAAYDATARKLVDLFHANFKKYESAVSAGSTGAGPV